MLRRRFQWLLEVTLILAVFVGVHYWTTRDAARGAAPPLGGVPLTGGQIPFDRMGERPVLVHFWATWCPACRLEQGTVDRLAQDHPVVTVAMQSGGAAEVAAYLQEHGLSFPVTLDEQGEIAAQWGVRGVPTSFILDRNGQIRFVTSGYTTGIGLRLRLWLAS